jgi:hypothetical protein
MTWFRKRVWPWLRRNWKWLLFPIGLIILVFGGSIAVATWRDYAEPPEDIDEKTRETLKKLRKAELEHDRKVAELERQYKECLQELTEDQRGELEELQDKSIEEVVTWFDSL